MAAFTKRFINNTSQPMQILGRIVAAGQYRDADAERWLAIHTDTDLLNAIDSGDIIVSDGTRELSAKDGKKHALMFDTFDSIVVDNACYTSQNIVELFTTTSLSYVQAASLSLVGKKSGTYVFIMSAACETSHSNFPPFIRVLKDGEVLQEYKLTLTANRIGPFTHFSELSINGTELITLEVKATKSNKPVKLHRLTCCAWRVM